MIRLYLILGLILKSTIEFVGLTLGSTNSMVDLKLGYIKMIMKWMSNMLHHDYMNDCTLIFWSSPLHFKHGEVIFKNRWLDLFAFFAYHLEFLVNVYTTMS
jgi:hypothetical protein